MSKILKKLLLSSLTASIIIISGQNQAMQSANISQTENTEKNRGYFYPHFSVRTPDSKLKEEYMVSAELKQIIDKYYSFNLVRTSCNEFPWLPGYVIKSEHGRICGSLLIKECVQKYHCDSVDAPNKRLYFNEWGLLYAVAPKIESTQAPFSLKQIKQLYVVVKKTGYGDIKPGNILNTAGGIAYIVDTDQYSFFMPKGLDWSKNERLTFLNRLQWLPSEKNAQEWLNSKIEKKKI